MAKLCRRHNLHTQTVYAWKERLIENGKVRFCGGKDSVSTAKRENDDLKRIVDEQALV